MKPGKRKVLDKTTAIRRLKDKMVKVKTSVRAKVAHHFRVIKRQFGHVKVEALDERFGIWKPENGPKYARSRLHHERAVGHFFIPLLAKAGFQSR